MDDIVWMFIIIGIMGVLALVLTLTGSHGGIV